MLFDLFALAKGGLVRIDAALSLQRQRLADLKAAYVDISSGPAAPNILSPTSTPGRDGTNTDSNNSSPATSPRWLPDGPEASLLRDIAGAYTTYETDTVSAAVRRLLSISQALTIITAGVVLKLSLLAEGHVPASVGVQWCREVRGGVRGWV